MRKYIEIIIVIVLITITIGITRFTRNHHLNDPLDLHHGDYYINKEKDQVLVITDYKESEMVKQYTLFLRDLHKCKYKEIEVPYSVLKKI